VIYRQIFLFVKLVKLKAKVRKHFFFEKKKQKTFAHWGPGHRYCHRPQDQKFFGSFFQKRTSCFLPVDAPAFAA
jgi:hypothetical protein